MSRGEDAAAVQSMMMTMRNGLPDSACLPECVCVVCVVLANVTGFVKKKKEEDVTRRSSKLCPASGWGGEGNKKIYILSCNISGSAPLHRFGARREERDQTRGELVFPTLFSLTHTTHSHLHTGQ